MSLGREFTYHYLSMEPETNGEELALESPLRSLDRLPQGLPRGGMSKSESPLRGAVNWLLMEDGEQ